MCRVWSVVSWHWACSLPRRKKTGDLGAPQIYAVLVVSRLASSRAGCASALPFGRLFFGNCTVKMAVKMDPTKLKSCPTRCHVVETRPVPARIRVLFESPLRVRSGSPALASHTPSLLSPLLSRRSKSQVDRPVRWRLRPQGGTLPYSAPRHGSANSPTAPAATPSRVPT